ncbi:hypothetical protein HGRIS_003643 [Hohenbuehelia grisea]|uniref:Trichothecene 3-O-acetyltransferase-like N-terminal domain-containing protein n=1 Tax=Hohenbuehelia grisea TaxID=104357 RepID=A0ABR3JG34_9AGAR
MLDHLDEELDILGQTPSLKIYTQICHCYHVNDPSSHSSIVTTLTTGLERLSTSFPWLAGQVVNEGASESSTGIFKIKPLDKAPRLVVKDLVNDPSAPTMDDLQTSGFPFRLLDESVIAPIKTIPASSDEPAWPVFVVQASFIPGGLILVFLAHHCTMDGTGQGQVISLFSKACHGTPFSLEEVTSGNLARRNLIPFLDDPYEPGPELSLQIFKPSSAPSLESTPPAPPRCTWAYFTFPSTSLSALKALATETITSGFVSTDDALSAFIWQSVTRIRLQRLGHVEQVRFARAVEVRRYFNVPHTYPGMIQNMAFSAYPLKQLVADPLGAVASLLRSVVDPKTSNLAFNTRSLATFFSRTPDRSIISLTAGLDFTQDIMLSSWAKLDSYELDFNLGLGKPEAVRRPQFTPVESLMYLLPRTLDGEITLAICLREDDMERLKSDAAFTKYARCIV